MTKSDLTQDELEILSYFVENYREEGMYMGFWGLDTKLSRYRISKVTKSLREKGLIEYMRGLMDEDGKVAGSGYCATDKGLAIFEPCDNCDELAVYDWHVGEDGKMVVVPKIGQVLVQVKLCEHHYEIYNAKIK